MMTGYRYRDDGFGNIIMLKSFVIRLEGRPHAVFWKRMFVFLDLNSMFCYCKARNIESPSQDNNIKEDVVEYL